MKQKAVSKLGSRFILRKNRNDSASPVTIQIALKFAQNKAKNVS